MATTQTLYLFTSQEPFGHSLLKLDITIPENEDGDWNISSPEIIRHFSSDGFAGQNLMRCGKFGSKFYILGGTRHHKTPEGKYVDEYPLDVMVFDPAAPDPSSDDTLKSFNVSPMNFGKLLPLMFEVGGKLYVLGGIVGPPFDESLRDKTFEEYDPVTNQWKMMPPPPIRHRSYVWCCALVLDCRTVVVQGDPAISLYIFYPTTYVWTKLELPPLFVIPYPPVVYPGSRDPLLFGINPVFIDDCFYVAQHMGTFRKVGPIPISSSIANGVQRLHRLNLSDEVAAVEWRGKSLSSPWPGIPAQKNQPEMFHLGDWRFCLMESTTFHSNSDYLDTGDYCIVFDLCILKVINHAKGSLKAECLHAANFTVNTGRLWVGHIVSCHLINNEMRRVTSSEFHSSKRRKIEES